MAKSRKSRNTNRAKRKAPQMLLERHNYVLLLIGIAMIVVGYVIMRLDNQVESFVSLYLAPLLILGGYLEIIYAILWRKKDKGAES